jgi:hypothetical protein
MSSASLSASASSRVGTIPSAAFAAMSRIAMILLPENPTARRTASSRARMSAGVGNGRGANNARKRPRMAFAAFPCSCWCATALTKLSKGDRCHAGDRSQGPISAISSRISEPVAAKWEIASVTLVANVIMAAAVLGSAIREAASSLSSSWSSSYPLTPARAAREPGATGRVIERWLPGEIRTCWMSSSSALVRPA